MSKKLTDEDFERAAKALRCDVPAIKAVAQVESRGDGFLPDGRPVILFERHKFHKFSGGRYSASHPDISSPKRGGYKGGTAEWTRMNKALDLDDESALKSASWGKFQIMGFNHDMCGFSDVFSFVKAMRESEGEQLNAFVKFIKAAGLDDELRNHRWEAFAQGYNGKDYAVNSYHIKLPKAYNLFKRQEAVRLGNSLAPVQPEPLEESASEIIQTTSADLDASPPSPAAQSEQPTETSVKIKDGNVDIKTTEGAKPDEKIAIEKPMAQNFATTMRNKIGAMTGGNLTLQAVRDYSEQAKLFGLSARFWMWISIIALIGAGVYLLSAFYKHKSDVRRDLEITDRLIAANSTDSNRVELVDKERIDEFKQKGYKIIER